MFTYDESFMIQKCLWIGSETLHNLDIDVSMDLGSDIRSLFYNVRNCVRNGYNKPTGDYKCFEINSENDLELIEKCVRSVYDSLLVLYGCKYLKIQALHIKIRAIIENEYKSLAERLWCKGY